jgi:hypothetical protein
VALETLCLVGRFALPIPFDEWTHIFYVQINPNTSDFLQSTNEKVGFNVTTDLDAPSYCNFTVPKELLGGHYQIRIDGEVVGFKQVPEENPV